MTAPQWATPLAQVRIQARARHAPPPKVLTTHEYYPVNYPTPPLHNEGLNTFARAFGAKPLIPHFAPKLCAK
jgi:hypothetical protein